MIYFRLAISSMKRHKVQYMLQTLQICFVFIAVNFVVGAINNLTMLYAPYEEALSRNGFIFMDFSYATTGVKGDFSFMPSDAQEMKIGYFYADIDVGKQGKCSITINVIEDNYYGALKLPFSRGGLKTASERDKIYAIVAPNNIGLSSGDKISVINREITISGRLTDPTYIPGEPSCSSDGDVGMLYRRFSSKTSDDTVIVMSMSEFDKLNLPPDNGGATKIVFYSDDTPQEKLDEDMEKLSALNLGAVRTLADVKDTTIHNIKTMTLKYLPLAIAITAIVLYGIINLNAITAMSDLKGNSIYMLCGMRLSGCAKIAAARLAVSIAAAFALAATAYIAMSECGLTAKLGIMLGATNILVSAVITALFLAFGTLIPTVIIDKKRIISAIGGKS